jgi:hypothetical protein
MLAAIAGAAGPLEPAGKSAFALAMLRRDGVLVPFAAHDGRKWSNPWPTPSYRLEAPINLASVPGRWWGPVGPTTTWIAWPVEGEPRAVHVTGPIVIGAHCLANVGLKTDYAATEPIPPPTQHHHPKDGLATTGSETIEPVEVLDDTAPEWHKSLELMASAIEKAESKAGTSDRWEQVFGWRSKRAKTPMKLEVLCRSRPGGGSRVVHYFEAVRAYEAPKGFWFGVSPDLGLDIGRGRPGCGLNIFSQGFFIVDGKGLVFENVVSTFTDCDRNAVDYALPMGTILVNGKLHWIMHWSGRGRERYGIVEIGEGSLKTVLYVPGGDC